MKYIFIVQGHMNKQKRKMNFIVGCIRKNN